MVHRSIVLAALLAVTACKGDDKAAAPGPAVASSAGPASATAAPATDTPPPAVVPSADDGCQELRNNGGIRACEKACELGSAKACVFAGYLHQEEDPEPDGDFAAIKLFQQACDMEYGEGCSDVAGYYRNGLGGLPKDPAKEKEFYAQANGFFEKECDAGIVRSCVRAADQYRESGLTPDPARQAMFQKKACDGGNTMSCDALQKNAGGTP